MELYDNKKIHLLLAVTAIPVCAIAGADGSEPAIRVGWIGPMSGPLSKYGAYQAAIVAMENINQHGGISGHPLELIFEDGKGNGQAAVNAATKLISVEKIKYILGGTMQSRKFGYRNRCRAFESSYACLHYFESPSD